MGKMCKAGYRDTPLKFLQLPIGASALKIASMLPEVASETVVPTDALLLVKPMGRGRMVLCQIPLGPWNEDPRSQLFLRNAIDYLLTQPQPMAQVQTLSSHSKDAKAMSTLR